MKKVEDLNKVYQIISRRGEFHQEINGTKYNLSFIRVLKMELIDVITMINEGTLFYFPEN